MGIEDGFAHTLMLAGAFLIPQLLLARKSGDDAVLVGLALGLVMLAIGAADRIADHL